MATKAIFLDRDGTISPDEYGYISNPDEYSLYNYTGKALNILQRLAFKLIVVTNQSGVARGYFTEEQLSLVHNRMQELILSTGVVLDKVYYSPYYAGGIVEPYNIDHEDRKPGLGLFLKAKRDFHINPDQSWMIGDRASDIMFGKRAGLKTILLLTGNGKREVLNGIIQSQDKPDFVVSNLLTAALLIERISEKHIN